MLFDIPAPSTNGTIGANSYIAIRMYITNGTDYSGLDWYVGEQLASNLYLTDVRMYTSDVKLPVRRKTFAEELHECEYYYQKSYDLDTFPTDLNVLEGVEAYQNYATTPQTTFRPNKGIKRKMRTTPSVVLYSYVTGTVNTVRLQTAGADATVTTLGNRSESAIAAYIILGTAVLVDDTAYFHWTADAEL